MKSAKHYMFFTLCMFCSIIAHGQVNVKDSLQTILIADTVEAETRFRNAYNLVFFNSTPEEAEALGLNVIYPFVKNTWESESQQLEHLARIYLLVSFCHRERGGEDRDEKEQQFSRKALETALESEDDAVCARCYMASAFREIKRGEVKQAHEYLYQAITYYDRMEMYVKSSEMLYVIASSFFNIKDTEGMQRVLQQMEEYLKKDTSKQSLYQYNVLKHSYFGMLLDKQKSAKKPIDYHLVDSSMTYIRNNVYLVDNFLNELDPNWMHGYAYYFLAKELNTYYPGQTAEIFSNLDKALSMIEQEDISRMNEANSVMELKAHIYEVRAKALFYKGELQESYALMSESLALLDSLKNYKNLSVIRHTVYEFMVEYYEKINRPDQALKYQKLLQESEADRYENEKVQAINDMSVKYEAEKKETRIKTLLKDHKTAQRIFWLTLGLLLTLLTAFLLIILFSRLKRKNAEQQLYETALVAELLQNELEKVQNATQQLKENPIKDVVGKISQSISASLIDRDNKKVYLERLSKLDFKLFEQMYQTSEVKITGMDMKYIICFCADMDVKDISLLFNVDPASIRTVRYRIRKKFAKDDTFRVLLH